MLAAAATNKRTTSVVDSIFWCSFIVQFPALCLAEAEQKTNAWCCHWHFPVLRSSHRGLRSKLNPRANYHFALRAADSQVQIKQSNIFSRALQSLLLTVYYLLCVWQLLIYGAWYSELINCIIYSSFCLILLVLYLFSF